MSGEGGDVPRGRKTWLALVLAGALVLTVLTLSRGGSPGAVLLGEASLIAVPGTLTLAQMVLLRAGYLEPALFGMFGLAYAVVGRDSAAGNSELYAGLLLALVIAVPFSLVGATLATNLRIPVALGSAVVILFGADQLDGLIVPSSVNSTAPAVSALGSGGPGCLLLMLGLYLLVALALPRPHGIERVEGADWKRVTAILFLPAFALTVPAGLFAVAQTQSVLESGLPTVTILEVLVALAAGGCLLRGGATPAAALTGTLFANALLSYLYDDNLSVDALQEVLVAVALAFIGLDLCRRRTLTSGGRATNDPARR